jgi:hypothetical protein
MGLRTGRLSPIYAVFLCTTSRQHWNVMFDALCHIWQKLGWKFSEIIFLP